MQTEWTTIGGIIMAGEEKRDMGVTVTSMVIMHCGNVGRYPLVRTVVT